MQKESQWDGERAGFCRGPTHNPRKPVIYIPWFWEGIPWLCSGMWMGEGAGPGRGGPCCSVTSDVSNSFPHYRLYSPPGSSVHGVSPGNNIGVGCPPLLHGIFPTQGSNPCLLHCRQIVYPLGKLWEEEIHLDLNLQRLSKAM